MYIPNSVVLSQAESFLNQADWLLQRDAQIEVSFEGGDGDVEPWALAALCSYLLACRRHDMTVNVVGLDKASEPLRMGVAKFLDAGKDPAVEPAGRYIPLCQIRGTNDLSVFSANVVPLLHLDTAPEQAQAVQYSISEMVRNVQEHAASPDGAVAAAELYPATGERQAHVSVGIADCGGGIRRSLARNFPDVETDRDAVLTAVKPGTTGAVRGYYGTTDNAGAGLFFTRRLASTAAGQFALLSGEAFLRSSPGDADLSDDQLLHDIPRFPGTVVAVEIGIDEPFEWAEFLAATRDAFVAIASGSAKKAARRARFE